MGTLEEQIQDLQTRVSSLENLLAFYRNHSILPDKYMDEPIIDICMSVNGEKIPSISSIQAEYGNR